MRKLLAHAFSKSSLIEQEELVAGSVDRFVEVMKGKAGHVVDVADLFERMAFDIVGDLAFGESFGALETGESTFHAWLLTGVQEGIKVSMV